MPSKPGLFLPSGPPLHCPHSAILTNARINMPTYSLLRLVKNSVLIAVSSEVGAVSVIIVSVPIVVDCLGPEGYGVWECILAV